MRLGNPYKIVLIFEFLKILLSHIFKNDIFD